MSCFTEKQKIYTILPEKSYEIIRNCPKCGKKTNYINTNNFRVNANGNALDVWLIYQCEKCKHTYNLTIYERVKPSSIDKQEYMKFLGNDSNLAFDYGTRKALFVRNNAVIDEERVTYSLLSKMEENENCNNYNEISVAISNPYELKVRADKILCEILKISRSKIKNMIKKKLIYSNEFDKLDRIHVGKLLKIGIFLDK